jgi:thiol-disulfide isomerase/thioredoxin
VTRRAGTRAAVLALLAVAAGPAVAGCGGPAAGTAGSSYVEGDGTVTLVGASDRDAPIDLAGTTLDGTPLSLTSLRGHPVVLNVWGSWCTSCRVEARDLQSASERLAPGGVAFVGINFRDPDVAQALAYERTMGVTYPSLRDQGGELLLALRGAVPPTSIPTTLVLDAEGRVAARVVGPVTASTLVGIVQDVTSGRVAG